MNKTRKKRRIGNKKSKYQYLRYFLLISVILFFIFVPVSNWYANNKIAHNQPSLVTLANGPAAGKLYQSLDWFFTLWNDPVTAATSNNGSLWAFTVLGVPLSDPLGLISEIVNSVKFPVKYLIGGLIPFLIALLLGRVFCAWLCPMTVLFGITGKIRALLLKLKIPLMTVRLEPTTRVVVFWVGLVLCHFFGAWVWHFVLPYISFTHEVFSIIVFSSFTVGFYFLVALLVLDIGLVPGEYCRSVCPTGFLLSYIGKFSLLMLKADKKACPSHCKMCKTVCPIELFPREGQLYSCHLCMKCVDNCPKGHIQLGLNPLYQGLNQKMKVKTMEHHESL